MPPGCSTPWWAELRIVEFEGVGYSDDLNAHIYWRNDPDRDLFPASVLKAYSAKEQFPAIGLIQFYAECRVEGIDGVFRSAEPVRLVSDRVVSFNPFKGELFIKDPDTRPIEFVNDITGETIVLDYLNSLLTE
jgi:hypothetical protein